MNIESSRLWYNVLTTILATGVVCALVVAVGSLVMMLVRWKTPHRRVHVRRLLLSLAAVPCLIGLQQALLWWMFLPALGREQMAQFEAHRAARLAGSSLVQVGEPMPDFTITDADGASFSLAEAQGRVVLINFFATWCGPCLMELPHIEEIWREFGGSDRFRLLVIGREETLESIRDFRTSKQFTFPIAADPRREVFSQVATELIPRTLVISPEGVIVYHKSGFYEHDLEELRLVLRQQLAGVKSQSDISEAKKGERGTSVR